MRLWTLHPRYLDRQGLLALWREGLLARAVLCGKTRGYRHHLQLQRFIAHATPVPAIDAYLAVVCDEATRRGYTFDRGKLGPRSKVARITVGTGQVAYEWEHLLRKLAVRTPALAAQWKGATPECHPLFVVRDGPIETWERA